MANPTAGATTHQPVFDVLGRSSARRERELALADGLRLVQWCNHGGRIDYRRPGHHTLSVYLQGGHATHLVDTPGQTGSPGCHCVLPAEHESRWNVAGPLRFVHLYLSAEAWGHRVVRLLTDWKLANVYDIYPQWRHRYAPGVTRNTEHVFGLLLPEAVVPRLSPREHLAWQWLPWAQAADRCFSPSNAEAVLQLPRFAAAEVAP